MTAIELALPPDQASRLFRHKAISRARQGRTLTETQGITWHDAEGDRLSRHGMILAEQSGVWRLMRPTRSHGFPSGTETLDEAASPDALEGGADGRTIPLAALLGRSRRVELADPASEEPLSVTLLEGVMRNVTTEQPCCRVMLEGEAGAAARLALELGETLPLAAARHSLPELARVLGRVDDSAIAHPVVPPDADMDDAVAAILGDLASALLRWIPEAQAGSATGVHQSRVAIRRFRSALLVFKGAVSTGPGGGFDTLRPGLMTLAAKLGGAREWDVFLAETGRALALSLGDKRIGALLEIAEIKREAAYKTLRTHLASRATQRLLLHLALLPALRPWRATVEGADAAAHAALLATPIASLAPGLVDRRFRRLVRGRRGLAAQEDETLHDARKDAKKLRYALEFLSPVLPRGNTKKMIRLVSRVQDQLGAINDGAAGAALMSSIPAQGAAQGARHEFATGAVLGWLASRGASARGPLRETWSSLRHQERFWRD